MSTTSNESPSNLNRLHKLWIADPTNYEFEFFAELRRIVTIAVAKTLKKAADSDIVSDVMTHILATPGGTTQSRLDQYRATGSFLGWVWTTTKRFIYDLWEKEAPQFAQVEDESEMEEHVAQFYEDNPTKPKVSVSWIPNEITKRVAEAVLEGATLKAASEAASLTENAGLLRLRKLGKTISPAILTKAYEDSEEAKSSREWRPKLYVTRTIIEADDSRLNAPWDYKLAA
jgi:hypothetical protein